jgi:hypothetical protein
MRRILVPILSIAMVVVGWAHVAAAEEQTTTVLVHLAGSGSLDHVLGELDDADAVPESVDAYDTIPWASVEVDGDGLAVLEDSPAVLDVRPDAQRRVALDDTIPIVGADDTTAAGYDGSGQAVAVLDTGVQTDHPFLDGRTVAEACFSHNACPGRDRSRATGTGSAQPCTFDRSSCEHGTHVAGIAVGKGTSGSPAQGVAPGASLVAVQVFSESGGDAVAYDSDILAALDWVNRNASRYHIAAVNLSLGGALHGGTCDARESGYKTMFDSLRAKGVAPVVAAGNDGGGGAVDAPACVSSAISVAATTSHDELAWFSNTASFVTVSAPGESVASSIPGSDYGSKSGTSMATPHVAGAFAVFRQAVGSASVADVVSAMRATGVPITRRDRGGAVTAPNRLDMSATMQELLTAPSPPRSLAASVGDGTVDLTWQAPAFVSGGHAVTSYDVSVAGNAAMSTSVTTTSAHLTGVAPGTYSFSVVARNADGASSAATVTATVARPPDAPTGVAAAGGYHRATVSWTAPADTGGQPISGWSLRASPAVVATQLVDASATSAVVTGLPEDTDVQFLVVARTAAGSSVESAPSNAVRSVETVPGVPTAVTVTASSEAAVVGWEAPDDSGDGGPLRYVVTSSPATGDGPVTTTETSVTIPGLANGEAYTFSVVAVNGVGTGSAATSDSVRPSSGTSRHSRRSGGGGGGGGSDHAATTPTTTPSSRPTTSTTVPATTAAPVAPLPTPAVALPGAVMTVRDGVPVRLATSAPAGTHVAAAATPSGRGAWVVTPSGRVTAAGDAPKLGSVTWPLNKPIVGMAPTASGKGYWLLGADGGVFSFGDAKFRGSTGDRRLNQPITTLASTATGRGYWLLAADGGVFSFGDARFHGSTGARRLDQPVVSMTATPTGNGYWLVGRDGGVYAFGDAKDLGSGTKGKRVVALAPTSTAEGYWLLTADGGTVPFGDAVTP